MMKKANLAAVVLFAALAAKAEISSYDPCEAVYQWSAEVTEVTSSETQNHPRGYLWIPPATDEVKGIVFGMHNMLEEPIFANPGFRETLAANDWGIVWVTPFIPANSADLTADEVTAIFNLMTSLAGVSGHSELKTVPLCAVGHSALGGFPFRFSAAAPERVTSMITVKGEWASKERDTGVFPYAVAAAEAGVRILQINGEYEDGVRRQLVSADLTNEVANADFTCWVDYGGGHFDWSDELCDAMARWIVGEKNVTLTREHSTGTFTVLGFEVNGTKVVQNENLHIQCLTSVTGSEFTMQPFFEETVPAGRPVGWTGKSVGDANDIPDGETAGETTDSIIIQKIQGPGEYLGDGKWGVRYNRYDPAGYRAKEITFQAVYPGDGTFKRSVQQGQVNVAKPRTTFTNNGTVWDVVKTGWTLEIPDGFGAYVREGPAKVENGKVVLADVPSHQRPNITVVQYKLDNTEDLYFGNRRGTI